jgi:Zn-dependent M16 (insulinase) family peptidase
MLAAALRRSRFPFHRTRNRTFDPLKVRNVMQAVGILETGFTRIRKLVSPLSGLKLYRIDFEGPLVEMTVAVATEAHDDSGCPHTLEHLCFMGSHSYPHKGFLDLLATRSLANGTNAWTAQDHTAYTLTTAGSAGLLQLLPVYMDHILRPNITREAFLTEVHHINEKAENAGVVYCEMQGIESNPESMAEVAFMRAAFPPNSGYHYETGGLLQDIRQLTVENVRDFHKKTYNLANTAIIIAGTIDDEALCKCISQIEADILGLKPSDSVAVPARVSEIPRRPHELFAASLPPFHAQTLEVRFPSKGDDEIGLVLIGWKGPPLQNVLERVGCEALLRYLTEGEVAPLHQSLLECDPPIASGVGWTSSSGKDGTLQLQIDGVEPSDLRRVPGVVRATLKKVIKSIDMVRLHSFVRIQVLEWQEAEEESISAHVDNCITDAVYGDYDISLLRTTMESQHLLLDQEKSWWLHIMQTYFMAPSIDVLATPSVDVAAAHAKAEATRFVEQAAFYGTEGLKACQSELEHAIAQHQAAPPPHLFSRFPVLSADGIPSIPYSNQVLSDRGTIVNFTEVKSQFVSIYMVFDTTGVPANIMQLTPLISDLFFAVDISASSSQGQIPWSKVVASLQTFSLGQSFGLGVGGSCFYSGSFETTACASIRAREDSAVVAVQWLLDLCNHAAPTAERIRVYARFGYTPLPLFCSHSLQMRSKASTCLS